ncbi:glycosyltransferase [bacterium]|nr:glycosyltransferase [bacterium]
MSKIEILHLTTDSRIGGTEKNIIALVTHLDKDRYESKVVALMPGGELINKLRGYGIRAECLGMRNKFDLGAIFKLYRLIKNSKINILHTYLFHANILGRIVGRLVGVPVIISSIRVMERRRYHLWIDWLTNRMVDVETCVCEAVRNFTIEKGKIRADKLVTIPNAIDVQQYELNMDIEQKKMELGIELNYPILGVAGRLHKQKGHIYLLKAMLRIMREYPRAVLLVMGDGPLRTKLTIVCYKSLINNQLKFLGLRQDIKEIMALLDVFILPSLWEGMPNVLLEAMALGKPIVATRVGGVEELIEDGVSGALVPPADEEALAGAVIHILARPDKGRGLGKVARKEAERRFPVEDMVGETEKLYGRLLR